MKSSMNADNKERVQVEETDDSLRLHPQTRDTDDRTECVSGNCCAEVKQEKPEAVKDEQPADVCLVISCCSHSQATI